MKGMGLLLAGPVKAEKESEGADVMAMKAFKKALSGSDTAAQLESFKELMRSCGDYEEDDAEE